MITFMICFHLKKMNQSFKTIGIALDTSGSMSSILSDVIEETIGILNKFQPEMVIFCKFSSSFECETIEFAEAKERLRNANASGSTAMYDGVTTMLLKLISFATDDPNVLAVVVTDGLENSSSRYRKTDLLESKQRIRELCGEDCIREICISTSMEQAAALQNGTPGLRPASSSRATRDRNSIREAFSTLTQ